MLPVWLGFYISSCLVCLEKGHVITHDSARPRGEWATGSLLIMLSWLHYPLWAVKLCHSNLLSHMCGIYDSQGPALLKGTEGM